MRDTLGSGERAQQIATPRYAALEIRGIRTHGLEFQLWGDSVVVDAAFERGDSISRSWPSEAASLPCICISAYSDFRVRQARPEEEWTQAGQWVTREKDRAIFVVARKRLLSRNVRFEPQVSMGGVPRYPLVEGKWTRKKDPRAWYFRLTIDRNGAVKKGDWLDADSGWEGGV
jgi:hypothetical protein